MTEKAFEKAIKSGAKFGFPSTAFKQAAASGGFRSGVLKNKVVMLGAFHIDGELVEIKGIPSLREDMIKLMGSTADLRYRGEFKEWQTTFVVKYNSSVTSPEIIVNLFSLAGFAVGIGEWRPEKSGSFGMFHVKTE